MSNDLDEATRLLTDLITTIETAIAEAEDEGAKKHLQEALRHTQQAAARIVALTAQGN